MNPNNADVNLLKEYNFMIRRKTAENEKRRRQLERLARRDRALEKLLCTWRARIVIWAVLAGIACALEGALVMLLCLG